MDFNIFKNNTFRFNSVNYMIKDLHEENKRLQRYLDSSKPRFDAIKLNIKSTSDLGSSLDEFFNLKEKDFKEIEERIERNREFILKLQRGDNH
ncbi:MAG: hypothetical protein PHN22_04530 [Candidatus ainarchaeum sp.]|nr:hypothetical protein [Candidatus ainarchaeum sp.]